MTDPLSRIVAFRLGLAGQPAAKDVLPAARETGPASGASQIMAAVAATAFGVSIPVSPGGHRAIAP